jgi:hypothetical protein
MWIIYLCILYRMSDTTNMIPERNAAGSQAGRDEDLANIAAANASPPAKLN